MRKPEQRSDRRLQAHGYYGVPLVLSTDEAMVALTSEERVLKALGGQIDGMRAAGYERSETLDSHIVVLNATGALQTAEFSRRRADGAEMGRLRATYLITDGSTGRRISALARARPLTLKRAFGRAPPASAGRPKSVAAAARRVTSA
jgi:hypothetical protein